MRALGILGLSCRGMATLCHQWVVKWPISPAAASPTYKLIYFPSQGQGGAARDRLAHVLLYRAPLASVLCGHSEQGLEEWVLSSD